MNSHLRLLVSACFVPSPLFCAPPADIARGTVVDERGVRIGSYAVRGARSAAIPEFPHVIRVDLTDGRLWVLTPTGVDRPTDTDRAPHGPILVDVQEFAGRILGQSVDGTNPDRVGELLLTSSLGDRMDGQIAFRPEPGPRGAHWIYSASFQTVHFISTKIADTKVAATGHYTIDRESSLDLSESNSVVTGVLALNGRTRVLHGSVYGSIFFGTSDDTTNADAVRTQLTLLFGDGGRKVSVSCAEVDEGGRIVAGTEQAFTATRSPIRRPPVPK
jgi:hypothetical protein